MIRWIARNIGRLERPLKIFLRTAWVFTRIFFSVTIFTIRLLLGAMAAWFRGTLVACTDVADEYTRRATMAGIGNHSKLVYLFFWLITFIQLIVMTFILAHLLVLAVFWIFVL